MPCILCSLLSRSMTLHAYVCVWWWVILEGGGKESQLWGLPPTRSCLFWSIFLDTRTAFILSETPGGSAYCVFILTLFGKSSLGIWFRLQTMGGGCPLTLPSLQLPWLFPYLSAKAHAGCYAVIFFIRTERAGPAEGEEVAYTLSIHSPFGLQRSHACTGGSPSHHSSGSPPLWYSCWLNVYGSV